MKKVINLLVFIMIALFLSCGSDSEDRDIIESEPVQFISAQPESGSPLHFNESVTVIFNRVPEELAVEPGTLNNLRPSHYRRPFSCW